MSHEPENPNSWHKVYQWLRSQSQKEVDKDARNLKEHLDNIKNERTKHTAKQVELNVVKLPGSMKANLPVIKLPKNSAFFDKDRSSTNIKPEIREWEKHGGFIPPNHRLQKHKEPASVKAKSKIAQFRKDALAHCHFHEKQQRSRVIASRDVKVRPPPTKTTITAPPAAMVHEYRNRAPPQPIDPTIEPPATFNPRKRRIEHMDSHSPETSIIEQREKRLKALSGPPRTSKASHSGAIACLQDSATSKPQRLQDQVSNSPSNHGRSPSSRISQTPATTTFSSPSRPSSRSNLAAVSTTSKAGTSSAASKMIRPPMRQKAKPQVNPLMPAKQNKLAQQ